MHLATDTDLAFASIPQIASLFRKRKLSPVELTKLLLERIDQLNPKFNAFLTVTQELALTHAKKAEAELFASRGRKAHRDRGPLHGIPISLKDNIYTKGVRTTAGSKILLDFAPQKDAAVVAQLESAGAVLLGKTNLHEFAYGVTSNNPHFGPVRNPWDPSRIPGGSSGGSAAAVAAGLCYASIGTDTGGSVRIPASLCGVVGLKPTYGRVSAEGVVPLSTTLDHIGPLTRFVQDAALLLDCIAAPGSGQTRSGPLAKSGKSRKPTFAIPKNFFCELLAPEVQIAFDASLRLLRQLECRLKEISIPRLPETEDAGNQIAWPEATLYHQQAGWFPSRSSEYGEDVRSRLDLGTKVLATSYLAALELRQEFTASFHQALDETGADALVVPTTTIPAPLIGVETVPLGGVDHPTRALLLRTNRPANLAGLPAISVPCGFTPSSLPLGLQFIGRRSDELLLLQIAEAFEGAHANTRRAPAANL